MAEFDRIVPLPDSDRSLIVMSVTESEGVMNRALYSIEETRVRLCGISRNSLYAILRATDLPRCCCHLHRAVSVVGSLLE
jgi:hypothetical protein